MTLQTRALLVHLLTATGAVKCWGSDGPQSTAPSGTYTSVSAGGYHTCGLRDDGVLLCWGDNSQGQLGDGTFEDRHSPVQVVASGVTKVATGNDHIVFIKTDGSVWVAGRNQWGQLGDGTTTNSG